MAKNPNWIQANFPHVNVSRPATRFWQGLCDKKHRDPVRTRTLETEQIVWELGPIFTEREMLKALILDSKAYKDKNAVRNVLSILGLKAFSTTLEDYSSSMRPGRCDSGMSVGPRDYVDVEKCADGLYSTIRRLDANSSSNSNAASLHVECKALVAATTPPTSLQISTDMAIGFVFPAWRPSLCKLQNMSALKINVARSAVIRVCNTVLEKRRAIDCREIQTIKTLKHFHRQMLIAYGPQGSASLTPKRKLTAMLA
ncbi:hypothetical protein CISG_00236 [Coccidioides immitis RMSCC 3703]|uniref:Uncharacterized protein n=1 Tax=Coccidioides immitis RMSCC 3703 TaxID=454286 RepID=A0A0J8TEE9_COCIT|nr:hypothetical protein CISG_00236 [Coccidioides immitis RMSCC 3703]